ncbi:hypothetical protein [Curtobacterium sp. L1-20]|uniref:hypothetical protein n=1 Tax=Curtobacterium sp. L1-20 TaxID=3138181 RepID=UPI003B51FF20
MSGPAGDRDVVADATWDRVADNLAGRTPTDPARRRRIWVTVLAVGSGIAAVAGVLVALTVSTAVISWIGDSRTGWPSTVALVLQVAGILALIVGVVWVLRRDEFPRALDPTAGVGRAERRQITGMTRGSMPYPPREVQTVHALATLRLQQTARTTAGLPGLLLISISQVFEREWSPFSVLECALSVFLLGVLVVTRRLRRQWRAVVAETRPAGEGEPTPGS